MRQVRILCELLSRRPIEQGLSRHLMNCLAMAKSLAWLCKDRSGPRINLDQHHIARMIDCTQRLQRQPFSESAETNRCGTPLKGLALPLRQIETRKHDAKPDSLQRRWRLTKQEPADQQG
jgi:hypothetical protein